MRNDETTSQLRTTIVDPEVEGSFVTDYGPVPKCHIIVSETDEMRGNLVFHDSEEMVALAEELKDEAIKFEEFEGGDNE